MGEAGARIRHWFGTAPAPNQRQPTQRDRRHPHSPRRPHGDAAYLNQALLRWEPETVVALSEGVGVLPFLIPGSEQMGQANVEGLRTHKIVLWSKHGTMSRSDESVLRAVDHVEYAETAARYEYMNIAAGGHAEGLTKEAVRAVAQAFAIDSP